MVAGIFLTLSLAIVTLVVAVTWLIHRAISNYGQLNFFPILATPLGIILLLPISYVGLSIFFPVAGEILYTLGQIYYLDEIKRHAGLILVILFTSPITAWLGIRFHNASSKNNLKLHLIILMGILLPGMIATIEFGYRYSQSNISKVLERAESLARNEPYCIQFGNREASDLSEFSAWEMGGKDMSSFMREKFTGNRAVLVLGEAHQAKLYYWSHRKQNFRGEDGNPPVYCTPRKHFSKRLSSSPSLASDPENLIFGLSGHLISIPKTFGPLAHGGSYPGFQIRVLAPGFTPRPKREKNDPLFNEESYASITQIAMYQKDLAKYAPPTSNETINKVGEEHGLTKGEFKYANKNGIHQPRFLYTATSNKGEIVTLIDCQYAGVPMCSNEFIKDGWTYRFHHSPALLSDWKNLQISLHHLVNSFVVKETLSDTPHTGISANFR